MTAHTALIPEFKSVTDEFDATTIDAALRFIFGKSVDSLSWNIVGDVMKLALFGREPRVRKGSWRHNDRMGSQPMRVPNSIHKADHRSGTRGELVCEHPLPESRARRLQHRALDRGRQEATHDQARLGLVPTLQPGAP